MFLGRKIIFICENVSILDSGWHVAMSRKKITFLCSNNSFLLNRVSTVCITSDVIHDFGLEKWCISAGRDGSLNPLKQRGMLLFYITTGPSIFPPTALTKKARKNLCLDFLPPFADLSFFTNPLSDKTLRHTCSKYFLMSTLQLIPEDFSSRRWLFLLKHPQLQKKLGILW